MIDEDVFWRVIDKSSARAEDQEEQEMFLAREIQKLTADEIIGFMLRTDKFLNDLYTSGMWCAAYIMNGGCSDDGFEYFRLWVISKGKKVFYDALENPDSLVDAVSADIDEYEFDGFRYAIYEAFENKTGDDIYDYIKPGYDNKKINFNWDEDDPGSMKKLCPGLFELFWE